MIIFASRDSGAVMMAYCNALRQRQPHTYAFDRHAWRDTHHQRVHTLYNRRFGLPPDLRRLRDCL